MPKTVIERSALEVKRLTEPGLHAVGGVTGLYLQVTKTGARTWILRATVGGKRRETGLGGFPAVTLAQAREKARRIREDIDRGIDPVEAKRAAQAALRAEQDRSITFEKAARKCHAAKEPEFKSEKHKKDWISSLQMHAFPAIGTRPVDSIELPDVLRVLEPIWTEKTETATRVRQRLESVLTWATVSGYRKGDNPARWEGNLKEVLPTPSKVTKVRHHRALAWKDVPDFMKDLSQREGVGARALEFAILTATRSGEVRGATWDEIDLEQKIWRIPGERMKRDKAHTVPLSDAAVDLLENLPRLSDCVFPNTKGTMISDATMSAVCKRMGIDATPHGFRSNFKDWARHETSYADEVSELALAHVNSDSTRSAYARDELIPQRKRMMAEWAKFLGKKGSGEGLKAVSS